MLIKRTKKAKGCQFIKVLAILQSVKYLEMKNV